MLDLSDVRATVADLLQNWLAEYELLNGDVIPALYVGEPPAGTKRSKAGVECIIEPLPDIQAKSFVDGFEEVGLRKTFMIILDLWQPTDLDKTSDDPPVLFNLEPAIEALMKFWGHQIVLIGRQQPNFEVLERAVLQLIDVPYAVSTNS